jgi:hypothetical protein
LQVASSGNEDFKIDKIGQYYSAFIFSISKKIFVQIDDKRRLQT